jgi:hypothetical protein
MIMERITLIRYNLLENMEKKALEKEGWPKGARSNEMTTGLTNSTCVNQMKISFRRIKE